MRPLRVGDVVRIKSWKELLSISDYTNDGALTKRSQETFVPEMCAYCGKEYEIIKINHAVFPEDQTYYLYLEDGECWAFSEWMFTPVNNLESVIKNIRYEITNQG